MASMSQICLAIASGLRTLPTLLEAPDYPPEQLNALPVLLTYPVSGNSQQGTSYGLDGKPMCWNAYIIRVLYTLPRKDLPLDIAALAPMADTIMNQLWYNYNVDKFRGTIILLGTDLKGSNSRITFTLVQNEWAMNTMSLRFDIPVLTEEAIS